jgi:LysM repeat protein
MNVILSEELHRINYLFGHKRGVVISEQTAPGGLKGSYDDEKKEYTVSKGDTLSKIGKAFGVRWQDIFEKNKSTLKSKNANLIYAGEKIIIPIDGEDKQETSTDTAKGESDNRFDDSLNKIKNLEVGGLSGIKSNTLSDYVSRTGQNTDGKKRYQLPPIDTEKLLSKAPEQVKIKIKEILDSNPYAFLTVKSAYDREFPEVESELAAKQYAFKITSGDTSIKKLYLAATQNDKTKKYKIYRVDELPQSVIDANEGKTQTLSTEPPKNTQAKPVEQPKPIENKPQSEQPKSEVPQTKTETQPQQPKLTTKSAIDAKYQAIAVLEDLILNVEFPFKDRKKEKWQISLNELKSTNDDELCSDENKQKVASNLKDAETNMVKYGAALSETEKQKCQQLIDGLKQYPQFCQTT